MWDGAGLCVCVVRAGGAGPVRGARSGGESVLGAPLESRRGHAVQMPTPSDMDRRTPRLGLPIFYGNVNCLF